MRGIQNFLFMLNENYVTILVCIGVIIKLYRATKSFLSKSDKDKIEFAKGLLSESILKMVADAELDYKDWNSFGRVKRSQVIDKVYEKYPILSKVENQDELIGWIDDLIDKSLGTIEDIFSKKNSVTM